MFVPHPDGITHEFEIFDSPLTLPFHVTPSSEAIDSNGNGISNAVEHDFARDLGIDPSFPHAGPYVDLDHGHVVLTNHPSTLQDSDRDGFPDAIERIVGTNPLVSSDHPVVVEAHHFPAGSGINLSGTLDVGMAGGTQFDDWVLP